MLSFLIKMWRHTCGRCFSLILVNNTDESSSSSSEENLEVSDEYLYSDYSDFKVAEGLYTNEPEYTRVEMKTIKFSNDEKVISRCSSDDSYNEEPGILSQSPPYGKPWRPRTLSI